MPQLHNTPLHGAFEVDHVLTKFFYLVRQYFMQIILSKMSYLNSYSFARKLSPCISFRLQFSSCCPHYLATLPTNLHALVV